MLAGLAKRVLLGAIEHAPVICFVGGVVAFGATVYMTTKAVPKVKKDLEKHNEKLKDLDETKAEMHEKEYKKAVRSVYFDTTINVVKDVGGAAACGVFAISLFGAAAYIPCFRYTQLSGRYMILDKTFKEYRKAVREEEGPEYDRHYMFKTKEAEKDKVDFEPIEVGEENDYYWVYSAETCSVFSSSEIINDALLQAKEENLTRKLKNCLVLTDNDVLSELLLFDEIKKNPLLGIKFGKKWKDNGDNTFKFDIEKIWVPDYTKSSGYVLKYMITYDKELL